MGVNRRRFLTVLPAAAGSLWIARLAGAESLAATNGSVHAGYPSHDPGLVRDVVGASHANIDRVRELIEAKPELAKASWDWGFGDWESALGAASHMGRRDIAELLIEHGARPNLFTHAMLGDLEVVKAAIEARPGIQKIPGPHGITLLDHARNGGEPAARVFQYLSERGDADPRAVSLEVSDDQKQRYLGRYVFGDGAHDLFDVDLNRGGMLSIRRSPATFGRVLHRVEEHGFAPGGAPSVRVRFAMEGKGATGLTIHDPSPTIAARRVSAVPVGG